MPAKRNRRSGVSKGNSNFDPAGNALRVVGGRLRGSNIAYSGDARTRPMKDRTREALFNLLGTVVKGTHVYDLFAGTGAVGLEALSRGAVSATFIEQHAPTAKLLRQTLIRLDQQECAETLSTNAFFWAKTFKENFRHPWIAFCCPPYDLYQTRGAEMDQLIRTLVEAAPAPVAVVVEAEQGFTGETLPQPENWLIREYRPAALAIYRPSAE